MIDKGTVSNHFRDKKIKMGYFNAPISNLNIFEYGLRICPVCKEEKSLYTFNPNSDTDSEWICIECFEKGHFSFMHNTELGWVGENIPEELSDSDAKNKVTSEAYKEMCQTPYYLTLQGEGWLGHCNDFMDYKGTWDAPDFTKNSPTNNGKALFMQMTDEDYNHLWDECGLKEDETEFSWNDCLYHTFQCRHCNTMRGYWEY